MVSHGSLDCERLQVPVHESLPVSMGDDSQQYLAIIHGVVKAADTINKA